MDVDVKRLFDACPLCVNKHVATPPHVQPLLPMVTNYPNHIVAFDLFGPFLPTRAGNVYVDVATDLFTKYVQLRASKSAKAEDSVLTLRAWILRNGAPTKLLTDRGTNYTSEVMKDARLYNIEKVFTTPGHKETNGQAERLVKTIVGMMVASLQQDLQWDENLDLYKYALNVSYHPAVQNVPYVLWFCRAPTPTGRAPSGGPTAAPTPSSRWRWRWRPSRWFARRTSP